MVAANAVPRRSTVMLFGPPVRKAIVRSARCPGVIVRKATVRAATGLRVTGLRDRAVRAAAVRAGVDPGKKGRPQRLPFFYSVTRSRSAQTNPKFVPSALPA